MNSGRSPSSPGVFKSVVVAYAVLLLHVVLLAVLGLLVLFFRGIMQYMIWIFLAGAALIGFSAYGFYRRMKAEKKTLREMLHSPLFGGREVEVSMLGGLATFKLGRPREPRPVESGTDASRPRLEDPAAVRVRELKELARLLEKDLITPEEFHRTKRQLFKSG